MRRTITLTVTGIFLLAVHAALAAEMDATSEWVKPIPTGGDIPRKFIPTSDNFDYVKREAMIPMRDGVKLHTVIVVPKAVKRGPIMLDRTPYSADGFTKNKGGPLLGSTLSQPYAELAQAGYIMVIQDVRGRQWIARGLCSHPTSERPP